jgi:hypothetical protein
VALLGSGRQWATFEGDSTNKRTFHQAGAVIAVKMSALVLPPAVGSLAVRHFDGAASDCMASARFALQFGHRESIFAVKRLFVFRLAFAVKKHAAVGLRQRVPPRARVEGERNTRSTPRTLETESIFVGDR